MPLGTQKSLKLDWIVLDKSTISMLRIDLLECMSSELCNARIRASCRGERAKSGEKRCDVTQDAIS